jgi:hypothetical protein
VSGAGASRAEHVIRLAALVVRPRHVDQPVNRLDAALDLGDAAHGAVKQLGEAGLRQPRRRRW